MNKEVEQVIMITDQPNKNGRIYSKETMEAAIANLNGKPVVGQIGMPEDGPIRLEHASHQVTDLRLDGDKVVGTISVLNTERGKALRDIINMDAVAYRPAGYGTLVEREDGSVEVTEFRITSINAVNKEFAA